MWICQASLFLAIKKTRKASVKNKIWHELMTPNKNLSFKKVNMYYPSKKRVLCMLTGNYYINLVHIDW